MMHKIRLTSSIIVFFILAFSCLAVYSNSLSNPFIWDDDALIIKNPIIRVWSNLPKVFNSDLYSGVSLGTNFYRPMQTLSYMWDYHFWKLDPWGYHLTNIILQILTAFLVFLFSYHFLKEPWPAFSAGLLFALCPLHTEAVTYISGRADMLMGLFLVGSFLLFIRKKYLFSWIAFMLALFCKELAITFPLVIIAYLFYYRRQDLKKISNFLKIAGPFLVIVILYIILRLSFLSFALAHSPALAKYPLLLRITVLPEACATYLRLLILPVDLHMSWTLKRPTSFSGYFLNWFALGMVCCLCFVILRNKAERKDAAFLLCWSLIFFLPQSGILAINAFLAEHFIYLSSISFFILVVFLLRRYLRRRLFIFAVIGLSSFYGMLTFSRNYDWRDPVIFYEKIIRFSPDSFQAYNNLGLQYEYRHLYAQAIREYKKALEIEPSLVEAHSNLANLYFKMGKYKEARQEYIRVEKNVSKEKAGELQNNIGCIYEVEGLLDEALVKYKLALELDPGLNFSHFNIARIYAVKEDFSLCVVEVLKSLPEIRADAFNAKRYREVISAYVKSRPAFQSGVIFYNDLGIQFAARSLLDGAIAAFQRAIELDPLYANAHFNLGLAYWKKGLRKQAIFEFKAALKINPNHLQARSFLAKN